MTSLLLALFCAAACLAMVVESGRARRAAEARAQALEERIAQLASRVEMAEQNTADAVVQAEATANVLLEKGLADEQDLEAARRRFQPGEPELPIPGPGNSVH